MEFVGCDMRLIFISDTHNRHDEMSIPDGDVLIHCGDSTMTGSEDELKDFVKWFGSQPHKHKVLVFGNHDLGMDKQEVYDNWAKWRKRGHRDIEKVKAKILKLIEEQGIIHLDDSGIEIEGVKFWGSPVQPWFHAWGFNRERGEDIQKHWDLIPEDTEILITHGPPFKILDLTVMGDENVGCENLLKTINDKLKSLKVHAFGHIHEEKGVFHKNNVTYVNASSLDLYYNLYIIPYTIIDIQK